MFCLNCKESQGDQDRKIQKQSHEVFLTSIGLLQNAIWEQELLQLKSQVQQVSIQLLTCMIAL